MPVIITQRCMKYGHNLVRPFNQNMAKLKHRTARYLLCTVAR